MTFNKYVFQCTQEHSLDLSELQHEQQHEMATLRSTVLFGVFCFLLVFFFFFGFVLFCFVLLCLCVCFFFFFFLSFFFQLISFDPVVSQLLAFHLLTSPQGDPFSDVSRHTSHLLFLGPLCLDQCRLLRGLMDSV